MVVLCLLRCTGNALATQTLFIALDTIFEASLASMKKLKQSFGLQAWKLAALMPISK